MSGVLDRQVAFVAALRRAGLRHLTLLQDPRRVGGLLHDVSPDLVLLDLHMPGVGGLEILEQIVEFAAGSYLPVLVLTADASPRARNQALSRGARDFLTKPLDVTELTLRDSSSSLPASRPSDESEPITRSAPNRSGASGLDLPLFRDRAASAKSEAAVVTPPAVSPPLSVRRAAPVVAKPRPRRPETAPEDGDPEPRLALETAEIPVVARSSPSGVRSRVRTASGSRRARRSTRSGRADGGGPGAGCADTGRGVVTVSSPTAPH